MIDQVEMMAGQRRIIGDHFRYNGRHDSIVILMHGFVSSKENNYMVAEALQESNIDSLAFDFNGHGGSDGDFADFTLTKAIEDCKAAVEFAKSKGYERIGLFGFSIGGFVALGAMKNGVKADSAVLCAPLSDFHAIFGRVDLKEWKESGMLRAPNLGLSIRLNYSFYEDGMNHNSYESYSKVTVPMLIVHGTNDDIVPISQSEELIRHLSNSHLLKINGATHNLFSNEYAGECLDSIVKWFKAKL